MVRFGNIPRLGRDIMASAVARQRYFDGLLRQCKAWEQNLKDLSRRPPVFSFNRYQEIWTQVRQAVRDLGRLNENQVKVPTEVQSRVFRINDRLEEILKGRESGR